MRIKPRRLALVSAIALLATTVTGHQLWQSSASPDSRGDDGTTVRQLQACSEELPWDQPSRVERVTRTAQGLVVQGLANAGCGPFEAVEPAATVAGSRVTISWSWHLPPGQPSAACLCTRRLEFVVPHAARIPQPTVELSESAWP